jgi:hypothetical protein
MIDAIYHPEGRWGWEPFFDRLQQLEKEETSPLVRAAILDNIENFERYYGITGRPSALAKPGSDVSKASKDRRVKDSSLSL